MELGLTLLILPPIPMVLGVAAAALGPAERRGENTCSAPSGVVASAMPPLFIGVGRNTAVGWVRGCCGDAEEAGEEEEAHDDDVIAVVIP